MLEVNVRSERSEQFPTELANISKGLGPNASRLLKVCFSKGGSVACWMASSKAAAVFGPLETHLRHRYWRFSQS